MSSAAIVEVNVGYAVAAWRCGRQRAWWQRPIAAATRAINRRTGSCFRIRLLFRSGSGGRQVRLLMIHGRVRPYRYGRTCTAVPAGRIN
eukprot:SAG31_NODE_436_length_15717_cov_5.420412_10_plen_89_part_00